MLRHHFPMIVTLLLILCVPLLCRSTYGYEHFQGLGFNLETEPSIFDGLYTGTETRDAVYSNQHLQPYEGFLIFRYFENIKPGHNGGGWVDTGGLLYLDRFAGQLGRPLGLASYRPFHATGEDFLVGSGRTASADSPILIPQIQYLTNDSWEKVSGLAGPNGFPILHSASYATGTLFVLTVPENFADLYSLPAAVLSRIRGMLLRDFYVRMEGPSLVSLFLYDNDTFIVESFRPEPVDVRLVLGERFDSLRDVLSGESREGQSRKASRWIRGNRDSVVFETEIQPHSFRVFQRNADSGRSGEE